MDPIKSRPFFWWQCLTLTIAFFCCPFGPLVANAQTSPSVQPGPTASSGTVNYTQREKQPNLDLDRDPVPSPDASFNQPVTPGAQGTVLGKSKSNEYVLRENVNEVVLDCTVVDDKGQLVTGLNAGDFQVFEDGVPQHVASFQYGDVPVSVGILVDNSGSMRDKRVAANDTALRLVRESNPQDRAFIVNFNNKAYLDQGFTSNISALEKGLDRHDARGPTALYDALAASAEELSRNAKWPKQVLLIITDGDDDASRLTLQQTVQRVQRLGGPVIYSIGMLFDPESRQQEQSAKSTLETLSNDTGGIAFFPQSMNDMDAIANQVAQDIRDQYMVGYHSTRPPALGGYRSVRVVVRNGHGRKLIVRTRKGYYPTQVKQMHAIETVGDQKAR
jgi:VWFA-related protein